MDDKKPYDLKELTEKAHKAKVSESPAHSFMSKNELTIAEGSKIYTAIQALSTHHMGSAPVVNGSGKMVGVVSEHDLLMQTATRDVAEPITFVHEPYFVTPETPLKDVLVLLFKKKARRIPVVLKDKTIVGVVTRMDVLLKLIGKK